MTRQPFDGFLTKDQAADVLGVKPRTLNEWAYKRIGPPRVKFGHIILYREEALRDWLLSQERDLGAARQVAEGAV